MQIPSALLPVDHANLLRDTFVPVIEHLIRAESLSPLTRSKFLEVAVITIHDANSAQLCESNDILTEGRRAGLNHDASRGCSVLDLQVVSKGEGSSRAHAKIGTAGRLEEPRLAALLLRKTWSSASAATYSENAPLA